MNIKRHCFSSPEIELKRSFQTFKKHFITFYNDVYGGSVEEYVEELPDGKRRAIYNEMSGLLKNVKRLDKVIMKMKENGNG